MAGGLDWRAVARKSRHVAKSCGVPAPLRGPWPRPTRQKGGKTHLNVHQMLKHIVFSQKNAARKKKCAMIAETEREKWASLQTSWPTVKELTAAAFLVPGRIIFPTDKRHRATRALLLRVTRKSMWIPFSPGVYPSREIRIDCRLIAASTSS